jgi:hypothetical protein
MFKQTFHFNGTLAANHVAKWTVDRNCMLTHVSAVASNDSSATLKLGNSTDDDAYLVEGAIGDSGVPVVKTKSNFVNSRNPYIPKDTVFLMTLDYDGSSGTAAQNVTIVLTFKKMAND